MLITVTGRRSGRLYTMPVRYVRTGETVRCFTSSEILWWRNLKGGAEVVLRIAGEDKVYNATVIVSDPDNVREALTHYLGLFPQDAAYHEIKLNKDKSLDSEGLDRASRNSVVVEARPRG